MHDIFINLILSSMSHSYCKCLVLMNPNNSISFIQMNLQKVRYHIYETRLTVGHCTGWPLGLVMAPAGRPLTTQTASHPAREQNVRFGSESTSAMITCDENKLSSHATCARSKTVCCVDATFQHMITCQMRHHGDGPTCETHDHIPTCLTWSHLWNTWPYSHLSHMIPPVKQITMFSLVKHMIPPDAHLKHDHVSS